MRSVPNYADSAKRWRDPEVRDTLKRALPIDFVVDMNAGPVLIEGVGNGSITVLAQLTRGGAVEKATGTQLSISADGSRVWIKPAAGQ